MIPHGDTTIQFSVEESECHNMARHTVSLTLSLRAGSGYCVIVGNRNGQLITTYVSLSNVCILFDIMCNFSNNLFLD